MTGAHTLGRWIRDRARTTPERIAIDFEGRLVTYRELDEQSERLAGALLERGLRRGDRLATLSGNSPEHVAVFFACAKAGLTLLPLSWRLSPVELAYQLDDAEPRLLLVAAEHDELAAGALAAASRPPASEPLVPGGGGDAYDAPVSDGDGLLLVYTSGTTGKPKGAVLTHANCFWTNLGLDLATGVSGDDVVLQVLPQFHCGGWNVQPLLAWWKGARVVLERTFDAARCLGLIEQKGVTTMMGVPANYLFMAQEPDFERRDLSSLRTAVVGGAPMPEPLIETWARRGVAVIQGYGLTEAAPNVLCLPPEDALGKQGYAGKPYPFVDVAVLDETSGALLGGPATGELVVRGPNVFAGYWRNTEATEAAFAEGWLRTGDIAERDAEGYYRIRGRSKELYISGGENVYPAEVEAALLEHAAVADAAVIGVPDERWGETGVAVVVLESEVAADEGELAEHLRARLASFKLPRRYVFVDELPRSGVGKVVRGPPGARDERGHRPVTDVVPAPASVPTSVDGRPLSARGEATRRRLLEAAEQVFSELGYHDASIVKLTEAAGVAGGTFYLYFSGKREIFDELVRDLNRRVRHAMKEASEQGATRLEAELLGFQAYFRFTAEHPALYRIIRQAEFVSPHMLRYHYDRLSEGYVEALRTAIERGEVRSSDPEVLAWALMGAGELIGMRWILWERNGEMPPGVLDELRRIIRGALEASE